MKLPRWASFSPVVPRDWAEATPQWMTQALQRDHPDAEVGKVTLISRDDGTNRRARFALEYARGRGPSRVFVKAHASAHRFVHLRNGNLFGEARLFASGARVPVEHPHVYHAVPDYPRLDFLLVMEDLVLRGGDPRDATRPLNFDQAASGLRELAALHREYWGMTPASHRKLAWVKPWRASPGWQVGLRKRVPIGLQRAEGQLTGSVARMTGSAIVDRWASYVRTLSDRPHTLLHGDAHIGNSYVLPGDQMGFLDWQVVRRGHWSQDVGYFLVGALTIEDRRKHERELVEIYRDALQFTDERMPTAEDAWRRYCLSPAYGAAIWLSTLGTDGWQRPEVSLSLAQRYAAAMEDLDTLTQLEKAS